MQTPGLDPHSSGSLWNDDIWNDLLEYVEDGRVIPIVGPDLLQVDIGGSTMLLDRFLARELAVRYRLPAQPSDPDPTLNSVVCQILLSDRNATKPYVAIRDIMRKNPMPPPKALVQLAEITHFNLFVSTTFDSLLEDALEPGPIRRSAGNDQHRLCTEQRKRSRRRQRRSPDGLSSAWQAIYRSHVGDLRRRPSRVCFALQSETRRPERLFDELKEKHLLLLGEDFPDWLARFFLRTARQHRLIESRDRLQILADSHTAQDRSLVTFLQHFSNGTRIYEGGGAIDFVDELAQRWRERNPAAAEQRTLVPPPADMPPGAIFISYASENLAAAQQLKAGLDEAGLPAWFDKDQLKAGQNFDLRICAISSAAPISFRSYRGRRKHGCAMLGSDANGTAGSASRGNRSQQGVHHSSRCGRNNDVFASRSSFQQFASAAVAGRESDARLRRPHARALRRVAVRASGTLIMSHSSLASTQSPWPGLNPFTESQQELFRGRRSETDELLRRVKRRPLTVLFGQSGLGKTSLVQAGLFPRLRHEGMLPIAVRLDYDRRRRRWPSRCWPNYVVRANRPMEFP